MKAKSAKLFLLVLQCVVFVSCLRKDKSNEQHELNVVKTLTEKGYFWDCYDGEMVFINERELLMKRIRRKDNGRDSVFFKKGIWEFDRVKNNLIIAWSNSRQQILSIDTIESNDDHIVWKELDRIGTTTITKMKIIDDRYTNIDSLKRLAN